MAAKNCDCIKRDVCVFYSDCDYPQVCENCGHYISEKGFTSTFIKCDDCDESAEYHYCSDCMDNHRD